MRPTPHSCNWERRHVSHLSYIFSSFLSNSTPFTQPFIIMITIPFASLGVMIGLLVSNNPLTFVTLIGLLTLTGIVVNDSLVLIDFINRYRKEHPKQLYLAIIRACHVRMRPIILTSLTTICGLAPMAFGVGGKSGFLGPHWPRPSCGGLGVCNYPHPLHGAGLLCHFGGYRLFYPPPETEKG